MRLFYFSTAGAGSTNLMKFDLKQVSLKTFSTEIEAHVLFLSHDFSFHAVALPMHHIVEKPPLGEKLFPALKSHGGPCYVGGGRLGAEQRAVSHFST